jgi:hypothetical protein
MPRKKPTPASAPASNRRRAVAPIPVKRALPANVVELIAQRIVKAEPSLLDECDTIYLALFDDPKFRELRGLDNPENYVEGSVWADDTVAAQMAREKGKEMQLPLVQKADLTTLVNKLRAAERRYNASRKQRDQAPREPDSGAQQASA